MSFAHLHIHSEYSLLDGACRIPQLVARAKELGQSAIAITDHGVMYGVIDFYEECQRQGIKPIIGCEVYVARRTRFDREHSRDSESYHLVLLCENNLGYENLSKMVSSAWTEGFYNRPRVDRELLEQYHEGLIALSACLAGEIPRYLSDGDYEKAKATALYYRDLFGEGRYYLELQDHGIREQMDINDGLLCISRETGIPVVVTNDSHYISREDAQMHEVLLCIQTKDVVSNPQAFRFPTQEFYVKSEEEMAALVPDCPEAISNTMIIADMCNVTFEFGNTKLPHFDVPEGQTHYDFFRQLCYKGLHERYGENPSQDIIERLEYELETINRMGYVDYYLIVQDFVNYAKNNGVPVGPGRGSGAGSIAAYCTGITAIDPLRYSLLFERFLNPERVSMPDFDIDLSDESRQKVIDYVIGKYGADHVAQIVTFGTMKARGAIRDVGRALGISYGTADKVAKLVPNDDLHMTIDKALTVSGELRAAYESSEEIRKLIDMARKIEGMPRHTSKHAAGVVITERRVDEYVPLAKSDEDVITQYPMTTLERLGLLKMDFLGLRNLTVIDDTVNMIRCTVPDFDILKIDDADKGVFEMLSQGFTEGVFQFESAGMRRVLTQLIPESVEDLIAVISLYRPGPMRSIPRYIENRHNPDKITYATERLKSILDVTNGCIVYQEQVMQICRELAGYSLGRADIVRRAMSKKKAKEMEREHKVFIEGLEDDEGNIIVEGALRRGVSREAAEGIFSEIQTFSEYAFNKSHAAAYAVVAYQTAYLKYHYPREYMAALLTSVLNERGKISEYIAECQRMGIGVLPPHVNRSSMKFTVEGNDIRFGLLAIKNLGGGVIAELIDERERNGDFLTFYSLCDRMYGKSLNRRALECLVQSGALDGLAASRRQMLASIDIVINDLNSRHNGLVEGQIGLFDIADIPREMREPALAQVEEFSRAELLAMEKEVTEIYLSGHPMTEHLQLTERLGCDKIAEIHALKEDVASDGDGKSVRMLLLISSVKLKVTKNNETMAFVQAEDVSGTIEIIIFPRTLSENSAILTEGSVVGLDGRVSLREDEDAKVVCEKLYSLEAMQSRNGRVHPSYHTDSPAPRQDEQPKKPSERAGLYLRVTALESQEFLRAKKVLRIFDGQTAVYVYCTDIKKLMLAPRDLWVDVNDVMLLELKNILGDNNVSMKQ